MKKTFTHLTKKLLIPIIGILLISNINAQTAPSFKEVSFDILLAKGDQSVFIPFITDGDGGSQTVTITSAVSSNDTIVDVVSYSYDDTYHFAELVVTDFGHLGTETISVTIDDGVDGTFTGDITINVVPYNTAAENGVNYEYYNKPQWQPEPNADDVPAPGSYEIITTTNGPNEFMEKDFFWQLMYGYIIPPTTGSYLFYCNEDEGGSYRMNLDDGVSQDMADLTLLGEDDSWATMIQTAPVSLEAGKPYFFRFTGKDIVTQQPFWIKWAGPDFPSEVLITSEYLKTAVDFTLPTVPQNFQAVRTGVDFVYLGWDESTDNNKVMGYNLYVNGELVADSLQDLYYEVTGLSPSTEYTFVVEAIDNYYNKSGYSEYINVTTYAPDAIAPTVPQNLVQTSISSDAVQISWDVSTDAETEIRGYNVYLDNVKINSEPILDNTFIKSGLDMESLYDFEVTALDAALNESARSNLLTITTTAFAIEDPPFSNSHKAVVSFEADPIDEFPGLGLQIGFTKGSVLSANKVYYGHFEDPSFASGLDITANSKDGTVTFARYIDDPYEGNYSAQISGSVGKYMNCYMGGHIYSNTYDYIIRFACKKDPGFTGNIDIVLNAQFQNNVHTETITPTDDWQVYELTIDPAYDGVSTGWYLQFKLAGAAGTVYLDEIEFYVAEHYVPGSPFSSIGTELLKEYAPTGVRWGGIEPCNSATFSGSTGAYCPSTLTLADMVKLGNDYCDGYTFFATGINDGTDWRTTGNTFTTFMDYLAGDETTYGGQIRISEGYDDLITDAKQIIIEFGNEVWGGTSHSAPIGANYTNYGIYARSMAEYIKMSDFYDADKIKTAYSGRSPDYYNSLHQDLFEEDNNEVDWLSLSGYMGGNMDLEPGVDFGESVMDYHKNGYRNFYDKMVGIEGVIKQAISLTGRPFPIYMYEGNMTTSSYYGTLAQGVTMTDYYVDVMRKGVAHAVVFNLYGGQWSLVKDDVDYEKYPIFYTAALINNTCKGINLTTTTTTQRTIEDAEGSTIPFEPLGAYAFNNDDKYSIALFSRDLEYDYKVQIDVPDGITFSNNAVIHTITGASYSATDADTSSVAITDFADGYIVTLPKSSMIVITFTGDAQTFTDVPFVNMDYKKSTSVSISTPGGTELTTDAGFLTLSAAVAPVDAFVQAIEWSVVENDIGAICGPYSGGYIIQGSGNCGGDGTVTIKACAKDDPTICDQVVVTVSNQIDAGMTECPTAIDENHTVNSIVSLYPNPAIDVVNLQLTNDNSAQLTISNIQGAVMQVENVNSSSAQIDISNLHIGVYFMKVETDSGSEIIRFIKE